MNKIISVYHSTSNRGKNATTPTGRKSDEFIQLNIWEPIQSPEIKSFLQIVAVPAAERINPNEHRYCLVIQPIGVRAVGGQYTANEAHLIAKAAKHWDWSVDKENRPRCLPKLEALIEQICKQSTVVGGAE